MEKSIQADAWLEYADLFAFVGNELLVPMNRSGEVCGLQPDFWADAPVPENEHGRQGRERLTAYARRAEQSSDDDASAPGMLGASVEFAKLFIGPPRPAADPWETSYGDSGERTVGFGRATTQLREMIADEGLKLDNGNNQLADHIGIECLLLSVLCERAARGLEGGAGDAEYASRAVRFVEEHPLAWIGRLREKVDQVAADGYYSALLEYLQGALEDLHAALR